jgi:hypothetical protein
MKHLKGRKLATITSDQIEWLQAEATPDGETAAGLPKFSMVAYTGGAMTVRGWDAPVVVDLAGLQWTAKPRPILKDHSASLVIGHTTGIRVMGGDLVVDGVISGAGGVAREIVESSRNGFPWQASIGADAGGIEFIGDGETVTANGREFDGPVYVSRRAVLGEVSFVALGADDATEARVAANAAEECPMSKTTEPTGDVAATAAPQAKVVEAAADAVAAIRAEAAAEASRIASIRKVAAGNEEIAARAISEGWDVTKCELECLRAERAQAIPAAIVRNSGVADEKVIEAAVAVSAKLPNVEKAYKAETLEAADSMRQMGLQELLLLAAERNGYHGRSVKADTRGVLQAAFSTMSLSGIMSNIANKFLLAGYNAVDQSWRAISSTRSVSDFKTVTSYRLNGGFAFDEVGPAGEITHGTVSEDSFTNAAKTYAKMFSVTRADIINDDLGALSAVPQRIGRGAALKMNSVFWTEFLADHTTFFPTNKSKKNFIDGATESAVSIAGLTTAEQAFLDQVDADGNPLAIMPAVWLVPTKHYATAQQIMASTEMRDTTASKQYGVANPHTGKFQVVTSPYLSNSAMGGGYSTDFWYLLASPTDLPVIEVAFLNGIETPTVEQADASFNTLGIEMRGFFDFGVKKQDYRAAVKAKNAA